MLLPLLTSAAALLASPGETAASCNLPRSQLIWSHPADGATDVPTNTRVFVLAAAFGERQQIVVNGQPVAPTADGRLGFAPPLAPRTQYKVEVAANLPEEPPLSFQFTTGEGPVPVPKLAPPIIDRVTTLKSRPLSAQCTDVWKKTDCYDTGQNTHLVFETQSRPLLFRVQARLGEHAGSIPNLWPASCADPQIYIWNPSATKCGGRTFRIDAVDMLGEIATTVVDCGENSGTSPADAGVDGADSGRAAGRSGACAFSGQTSKTPFSLLAVALFAFILNRRRRPGLVPTADSSCEVAHLGRPRRPTRRWGMLRRAPADPRLQRHDEDELSQFPLPTPSRFRSDRWRRRLR